jgi:RNA polymerase sigma-70 factor (ECF subfamily)
VLLASPDPPSSTGAGPPDDELSPGSLVPELLDAGPVDDSDAAAPSPTPLTNGPPLGTSAQPEHTIAIVQFQRAIVLQPPERAYPRRRSGSLLRSLIVADDFALLAAWQAGDARAGDDLVRRHFPAVYRFFRSKLPEAAEDLVQRTFLGCVAALPRVREEPGFRPFLFGIARNQLLLELRHRTRHPTLPPLDTSIEDALGPSLGAWLDARRDHRVLLQALRQIPIDHQIALELFYWEGLGIDAIASVLEVAPGTVKSRLARARANLAERFAALLATATDEASIELQLSAAKDVVSVSR